MTWILPALMSDRSGATIWESYTGMLLFKALTPLGYFRYLNVQIGK
jgi:hypothetical protein